MLIFQLRSDWCQSDVTDSILKPIPSSKMSQADCSAAMVKSALRYIGLILTTDPPDQLWSL